MTDRKNMGNDLLSLGSNAVGVEGFFWHPIVNPAHADDRYVSSTTTGGSPSTPVLTPSDLLVMCDGWDAPKQIDSPSAPCGNSLAAKSAIVSATATPVSIAVVSSYPTAKAVNDTTGEAYISQLGVASQPALSNDIHVEHQVKFGVPTRCTAPSNLPSAPAPQCPSAGLASGCGSQNILACFRWKDGPLGAQSAADSEDREDDPSSHYLWSSACATYPTLGNDELLASDADESPAHPPERQQQRQLERSELQGGSRSPKEHGIHRTAESSDDAIRSNLFISGLRHSVTDCGLHELFSPFGDIESAKVMLDIHTGRSRGIAFVKFIRLSDAQRAAEALNGSVFCGETITVRVAKPNAAYRPGAPTNKTFVRNVPLGVKKEDLVAHFSNYGQVVEVSIHGDTAQCPTSKKRNVVFITYATREAAAWAAQKTHTTMPFPDCEGVPLLAKVAEDSAHRIERLARRGSGKQMSNSSKAVSSNASPQTSHLLATPPHPVGQLHPQQQSLLQFQQQHTLQQQLFLQQQQQALQQQLFLQQQQQQQQACSAGFIAAKIPQAFSTCTGTPSFVMPAPGLYNAEAYTAPTAGLGIQQGLYAAPLVPLPSGPTGGGPLVFWGPERQLESAVMYPPPTPQPPRPQSAVMYYVPGSQMPLQMPITADRLQPMAVGPAMRVG